MPPKIQALGILGKIIQQRKIKLFLFNAEISSLVLGGTLFFLPISPRPVSLRGKLWVFHSPLPAEANKKLAPLLNFRTHFKVRPSLGGKDGKRVWFRGAAKDWVLEQHFRRVD